MKRPHFSIGGIEIAPGTRRTVDIAVAGLYNRSELYMNVHVVHGRSTGPVLFVSAAVHGDELNGVEIIRRLLQMKLLKSLRGTLLAVPVVNAFGFISGSRYLPDRRDLNRFFPGSAKGSLTSRQAAAFMEEIVDRSSHGIDIHTGSGFRCNLPQIRAYLGDERTRAMAMAFGAPVVMDSNLRDGSLRQAAQERGIPMLLYEAGQAMRFEEIPIRAGLRGVVSVMRHLGMLPGGKRSAKSVSPIVTDHSTWARSGSSGIYLHRTALGDIVRKGRPLGLVTDPFGEHETPTLAPIDGIVIGRLESPLVHTGDAVCHVAAITDRSAAAVALENFQREYELDAETQTPGSDESGPTS